MNKRLRNQILSSILMITFIFGFINSDIKTVYADMIKYLPEGLTSTAIGSINEGSADFDVDTRVLTIEGTGGYIGKDKDAGDSYQFASYKVQGDSTIIARLIDFDMSKAENGQAGVFIRSTNDTDNADYFGVYVEPSLGAYRYAYRDAADADSEKGGTGAETIEGITSDDKDIYIKLVKNGKDFKYFISDDITFPADKTLMKGQEILSDNDEWYVGFIASNGNSDLNSSAKFDNISIIDTTGLVFDSNTFVPPVDRGILPEGFMNSSVGNDNITSYAGFDKENKDFTIEGSGTYIGKDAGAVDNYQFINYEVEGDAAITARLVDFDMSSAKYGQAGVFVRSDNSTDNADYFGVYVEPSKNQYRYAYRDNSQGKSGAAAISGLTSADRGKYIKIVKQGSTFSLYISDTNDFSNVKPINQGVTSNDNTWNVGFVVSNGGSELPAEAIFDNVRIETQDKVYYDSTLEVMPVDTVEGVKVEVGDSKVTLSWSSVEGATGYIVKRASSIDGNYEEIAAVSENIFVDDNVANYNTYYYVIVAANDEGISYDSKAISAMPNNSNPLNLQYGEDAAKFTMTEEPEDTVFDAAVRIAGYTDKDGTITIEHNGKIIADSIYKADGQSFEQQLNLRNGRNTINVYQTTEDGKRTLKSFNIVRLVKANVNKIVDSSYNGDDGELVDGIETYRTISAAVSSVSTKNTERVVIFVKNGVYKEKTIVQSPYISIIGEDSEKTVWTYDAANGTINPETGKAYGTGGSASVIVKSKAVGFTAENITIANEFKEQGNNNEQAVALNNQADQSAFINVRFIGNQDTLLADASSSVPARQYYYKSYIEGDVDFIFGRAQAVFNDCDIVSLNRGSSSNNGYITAADTWDKDSYGYLIINSRLLGDGNIADETVSLGRPWRPSSQTEKMTPAVVYINNYMGSHITTKGWDDMGADSLAADSRFFEFASFGPGARLSETRPLLSVEEAESYKIENVFAKNAATVNGNDAFDLNWMPTSVEDKVNIETLYGVFIPVSSVTLDKEEVSLKLGETTTLNVVVGPEDAYDKAVTFESSDENIVTVDENGFITSVAAGTAIITVTSGDITASCLVTVLPIMVGMNNVPEIIAEDVIIKVGDTFEAMNAVTANDKEDGDITSNIEVVVNTVDTLSAGEYKVVYKVTDSQGASVTKEIMVTVEAVEEVIEDNNSKDEGVDDSKDETINDSTGSAGGNENNTTNDSNRIPNTGGTSSVMVGSIAVLLIIAGLYISRRKVRK